MRLLTHNMLKSHVKGVKNGYPLLVKAVTIEEEEVEFNPEFIVRMLPRLNWAVLVQTLTELGRGDGFPQEVPENPAENEDFLRQAHHALLEIHVTEGELICPESERSFKIANGIPNMLLGEDEV